MPVGVRNRGDWSLLHRWLRSLAARDSAKPGVAIDVTALTTNRLPQSQVTPGGRVSVATRRRFPGSRRRAPCEEDLSL